VDPTNAKFCCSFGCGITAVGTASAGVEHYGFISGTPTIIAAPTGRTGSALRFTGSGYVSHTFATAIASPGTAVVRFYVRFVAFPTSNTFISYVFNATGPQSAAIRVTPAGVLAGIANGVAVTGITGTTFSLSLNTWYRIDYKAVGATTRTIDVQVTPAGGSTTTLTQGSVAGTATAWTEVHQGNDGGGVVDVAHSSLVVSGTSAEYPIGEGVGTALYPTADGTHVFTPAGDFLKGTSGATSATSTDTDLWSSLDNPLTTTAGGSWITDAAAATDGTEYVQFNVADAPADLATVNAVMLVATTHSASTTANNFTFQTRYGGAGRTELNLDLSETAITVPVAVLPTNGGSTAWDAASLTGIVARFFSTDVTPDVYLDGFCYEVDYVPAVASADLPYVSQYRQLLAH